MQHVVHRSSKEGKFNSGSYSKSIHTDQSIFPLPYYADQAQGTINLTLSYLDML